MRTVGWATFLSPLAMEPPAIEALFSMGKDQVAIGWKRLKRLCFVTKKSNGNARCTSPAFD